jgi:glycosyltransferase involved in cell wall biosynthesis
VEQHPVRPCLILVIPCYNEAHRLQAAALAEFVVPGYTHQLLLVNDGSGDDTLRILESLRAQAPERIDVLDLQPNRGKAEAVRQGLLHALARSPDYVGYWDADLATPLSEIERFCAVFENRPCVDMVFGARVKLLGRVIQRKTYRHYFGRVFATVVSIILNLGVYDTQCGAKLFRANEQVRQVFAAPFLSRWVFDVEIIARYKNSPAVRDRDLNDAIYELPLREWRDVGGSKVGIRDAVQAYIDLAKIYRQYLRGRRRR